MKPRCSWTGYLKISLVTVPVRVYTAISTTDKIFFNQLHKTCHQRIKQRLVCPVHGEVERADLEKGYEFADGQFVTLTEPELEAVRLESTGTIELVQFVRADELDPMFLDTPYYVGPQCFSHFGHDIGRIEVRRSQLQVEERFRKIRRSGIVTVCPMPNRAHRLESDGVDRSY